MVIFIDNHKFGWSNIEINDNNSGKYYELLEFNPNWNENAKPSAVDYNFFFCEVGIRMRLTVLYR